MVAGFLVDVGEDFPDGGLDFRKLRNFVVSVYECNHNFRAIWESFRQHMFVESESLPYPTFKQIAFNGTFEVTFGHRHQHRYHCRIVSVGRFGEVEVAQRKYKTAVTLGKQSVGKFLSAQSLRTRKTIFWCIHITGCCGLSGFVWQEEILRRWVSLQNRVVGRGAMTDFGRT